LKKDDEKYKEIVKTFEDLLEEYRKLIEDMEKTKREIDEKLRKTCDDGYKFYDQMYSGEDWWKALKTKWGPEGIKKFVCEYMERCLLQDIDLEKYDIENALKNAAKYDSPEASYEPLMKDGLFPPPLPLEKMLEEASKKYEKILKEYEAIKILKDIYEKGLVDEVREFLLREERETPLKPILSEGDYQELFRMFISIVVEKVEGKSFIELSEKIFKTEWNLRRIMYMSRRDAEVTIKEIAEEWAKAFEELVQVNRSKYLNELVDMIVAKVSKKFEELAQESEKTVFHSRYISPKAILPREPIDKEAPFPRKITSQEHDVLWMCFVDRLSEQHDVAPEACSDEFILRHWRRFAWEAIHESWEQVLKRFELMIQDIVAGRPPRIYRPKVEKFNEIPREPVIWTLLRENEKPIEEEAKTIEELAKRVYEETKVKVTAEQVKKILEEEYAKENRAHIWFKLIRRERDYYLWNLLRPKDLEDKVKKCLLTHLQVEADASIKSFPKSLKEIIDRVRTHDGYIITEEDAKKWIKEELEKPPEKAHTFIQLHRDLAEKLIR
jgi:hypothetical protein